eukprot:TRINITY_DN2209_c2_g1_i1.p1 TRINITY_DN2209_c2_g1~~TRINITY_DN2209_c2_g1_i1.p1  ORF type:complete len:120 (-),score=0.41 TRINITY_DN2209_c2_g1_i1:930-1289(-)
MCSHGQLLFKDGCGSVVGEGGSSAIDPSACDSSGRPDMKGGSPLRCTCLSMTRAGRLALPYVVELAKASNSQERGEKGAQNQSPHHFKKKKGLTCRHGQQTTRLYLFSPISFHHSTLPN